MLPKKAMYCAHIITKINATHYQKVRLYSCITSSKISINENSPCDKKWIIALHKSRNFSLQPTIESIIKTQGGIFKSLSESVPVSHVQDFLVNVHTYTGLPWWASIVLSTILLRSCITVPFAIHQNLILAKVQNISAEMPAIAEELKKEMAVAVRKFNWDEKYAKYMYRKTIKEQWNKLIVRENCHPFKASLLLWVQIPMWVCLSISLRNLVYMLPKMDIDAQIIFTEMSIGGFGWIPNLTIPDSSLILPVILGLTNLTIIELQVMSKLKEPGKFQRYITHFFRGFSLLMIPIAASVPSCLCVYWTTSSIYGLIQNLILMSPKIKRLTRVPKTSTEISNPYTHLLEQMKKRLSRKRNLDSGS